MTYLCSVHFSNSNFHSLTSVSTLASLQLLPQTNSTLHNEFTTGTSHIKTNPESPSTIIEDNSLAPSGCVIPFNIVHTAVITRTCDLRFEIGDQGVIIIHTGIAKQMDDAEGVVYDSIDANIPAPMGELENRVQVLWG